MSTIPLWRVLELTDDPGTGLNIGLDDYPLYDDKPEERLALNKLIIDHFYLRDIGQETISIFTFMLRRTMHEIMPVYNELYLSKKLLAGRELATYDLSTVRNGTANESSSQNQNSTTGSTADSKARTVFFDTPQTALSRNKDYAANATDVESDSTNTGTSSGTGTAESTAENTDTSRTTGTQGSLADMLTRYRSTIINVDLMLLNDPELTSMFYLVWDDAPIEPPHRHRLGMI